MMIGLAEGHAVTATPDWATNSFTMAFPPSNIFAWMALTQIVLVDAADFAQIVSGISQITTVSGAQDFPWPEWAPSAFADGCTPVTFNLNAGVAGDGASGRARFAVSFWS